MAGGRMIAGGGGLGSEPPDWSDDASRQWQALDGEVQRRLGPGVRLQSSARAAFQGRLGGDLSAAMRPRGAGAHVVQRAVGGPAGQANAAQGAAGDPLTIQLAPEQSNRGRPRLADVDPEALAERVYRRMAETLRLERERSGWNG